MKRGSGRIETGPIRPSRPDPPQIPTRPLANRPLANRPLANRRWRIGAGESGESNPDVSFSPGPVSIRAAYWESKRRADQLRGQIQETRQQLQQLDEELGSVAQAIPFRQRRQHLDELAAQQTSDDAPVPTPDDLKLIRRLDQELAEVRRQLQAARAAADVTHNEATHPNLERVVAVLADWPRCQDHLERLESLRRELPQTRAGDVSSGVPSQADVTRAIAEIRHAARERRASRRAQRNRAQPKTISATAGGSDSRDSGAEQVAELRRQIHQLRDGTRQLLARQLLSRQAILGIGLLFSAGTTTMLAALLLNLDGAELATGSIGLTCLIAAALLKVSFERTPSDQLRAQRIRVTQLIDQLQHLHATDTLDPRTPTAEPAESEPALWERAPSDSRWQKAVTPALPAKVPTVRLAEDAERNWHATLARWDLPADVTPSQAIAALGRRMRTHLTTPTAEARADLRQRMVRQQQSIDDWCERAAACLDDEADSASSRAPREWLARLQAAQRSAERHDSERRAADGYQETVADLQRQLKKLKLRRAKRLERVGAEDLAQLEASIIARAEQDRRAHERIQLEAEFERELGQHPRGAEIRQWLADQTDLELHLETLRADAAARQELLTRYQRELQSERSQIEELASRTRPAARRADEWPDGSRDVSDGWEDRRALTIVGAILARLAAQAPTPALAPPAPTSPLAGGAGSDFTVAGGAGSDGPSCDGTRTAPVPASGCAVF